MIRHLGLLAGVWLGLVGGGEALVASAKPAGVAVALPYVKKLLHPCSRNAPAGIDGYWVPSEKEVLALEERLARFLAAKGGMKKLSGYHLQYGGFVRGRKKLAYVTGYDRATLKDFGVKKFDPAQPLDLCETGKTIWGVEYDVASGTFDHFEFSEEY